MFSSTSLIPPRDTYNLWYASPHRPLSPVTNSPATHGVTQSAQTAEHQNHHHHHHQRGRQSRHAGTQLTALQQLQADENVFAARKATIRRFGATWIRPPGVPKTYQAMVDEAAERAEQEAIAERERRMQEAVAAQEEAERVAAQRGGPQFGLDGEPTDGVLHGDQASEGMDMDGEEQQHDDQQDRDLDDDVPEAEAAGYSSDVADGDEEVMEERDLDDDVPEAGSFQHSDTEVEDFESDDDDADQDESHLFTRATQHNERLQRAMLNTPDVVQDFSQPPAVDTSRQYSSPAAEGESSIMLVSSPSNDRGPQNLSRATRRMPRPPPDWSQ